MLSYLKKYLFYDRIILNNNLRNYKMKIEEKLIAKKTLLTLAIVNFSVFLLYFIARFIDNKSIFASIIYTLLVFFKYINKTLLPMMVATASLITYAYHGAKKAVLRAFAYSSAWIAYALPYYAFYFADGGLLIDEVLFFTSIFTLATLLIVYIISLLVFILIIFATKRIALRKSDSYSFSEELKKALPQISASQ